MTKTADAWIKIISYLIAFILVSFLFAYPAMLLWNGCLVPAIPAIQEVSWLQMWGIAILISLITAKAKPSAT